MTISYVDKDYFLNFEDNIKEQIFFINSINLSFSLIKETNKNSKEISPEIHETISKMIKYYDKDKFLRKESKAIYRVRKEYLDLLLEHIETNIMILLKEEKTVIEASLKNQYQFLLSFFRDFLEALKEESEKV